MSSVPPPQMAVMALVALGCACSSHSDGSDAAAADASGGEDGAFDAVGDINLPRDTGAGDALRPSSGSATFVVADNSVSDERWCDLDGDGLLDNAFADLGPTQGRLLAAALTSLFQASIEEGFRILLHFPWLDDLALPADDECVLIVYEGRDDDSPRDATDDFSGEEAFEVHSRSLDGCGEPITHFAGTRIAGGELSGEADEFVMTTGVPLRTRNVRAAGEVAPRAESAELRLCASAHIHDLGDADASTTGVSLSLLELLLAGGATFGLPAASGVSPDVDVDGDGLERILLGDDDRVLQCIDGDNTVIEGADCWRDTRMADAFSLNFRLRGVPALFGGRPASWASGAALSCEGDLPDPSLFDPL